MTKPRLIIVDDEVSVQQSLRNFFEDEGFEVMAARSAENALELLAQAPANLAVVDMRLPGMDGQTFIPQALRVCPGMGFLIYTGSMDYILPGFLGLLGVKDEHVFRKPLFNLDILLDAAKRLLEEG
jgi:DNA-binding NtrC family response regulator